MKIRDLVFFLIFLLAIKVSAIHLRTKGNLASRILMRAYNDPDLQAAVKSANVSNNITQIKRLVAVKIGQIIQKDPVSLNRLANASFPEGTLARVILTQDQKVKLLNISINNPQLLNNPKRGAFLALVGEDPKLKNVYDELLARRNAFVQVKDKLFPKVKADPIVAAFLANNTKKSDPEFRKAFKSVAARIIKSDPELQKIVAKSRFGFDPIFSQLSEEQQVKLLNLLLNNEKTETLRWKSPEYLKQVQATLQKEPTLAEFYSKNKEAIQKKIKLAEQRKVRWLARQAQLPPTSHFVHTFEDIVNAGAQHLRQKNLASAELLLMRLKQHPNTRNIFTKKQPQNPQIIKQTTIDIIKNDRELQAQLANDMFSRGPVGKLMTDRQRQAMLRLALNNPALFESSGQGALKRSMVQLMKTDPNLAKFYKINERLILANMK